MGAVKAYLHALVERVAKDDDEFDRIFHEVICGPLRIEELEKRAGNPRLKDLLTLPDRAGHTQDGSGRFILPSSGPRYLP